jgi:hypothetical protein
VKQQAGCILGYDDATDEEIETENSQYANFSTPNRYKKYYDKIQYFYKTYLDNDNFRHNNFNF